MRGLFIGSLLVTVVLLSGCATGSRGSFCDIYEPVYTIKSDSEKTKKQVDKNNAVWLEKCE